MTGMQDRKDKMRALITTIAFAGVLIFMMILCIFMPNKAFSENENRTLTKQPEFSFADVASGKYMKAFEQYASDQIIGRDSWVALKSEMDIAVGKKDNGRVYFGKEGYLFQIAEIDEVQLEKNIGYLEGFFQKSKEVNAELNISVLVVPTSIEIMKEMLPKYAKASEEDAAIKTVKDKFGPLFYDVTPALEAQSQNEIYYRTDHHWTTLGAYYAYAAWAEAQGLRAHPMDDYDIDTVANDFYGTLHSKANIKTTADSIQRFDHIENDMTKTEIEMKIYLNKEERVMDGLYDSEYLSTKDKYSYFLSGTNPLTIIENSTEVEGTVIGEDLEQAKTLLILKDSYAHCFIPFLTDHFDSIIAVDLRYYKESVLDLIHQYDVTDLMVLYNIDGFSTDRNLVYLGTVAK